MGQETKDKQVSIAQKTIYEELKNEINLSAKLNCIYAEKLTTETVNLKMNNQLNSIKASIWNINTKFAEKSKKLEEVNQKIEEVLDEYELALKVFANRYDKKIEELIIKKAELEYKLMLAIIDKEYLSEQEKKERKNDEKRVITHSISKITQKIKNKIQNKGQVDVSLIDKMSDGKDINQEINEKMEHSEAYIENQRHIVRLEKEIRKLSQKITQKNKDKTQKIFEAMEVGDKQLSTEIRKPRAFKKIKKFFVNRFNTYHVIMKTVIEPLERRIDEFKVNELDTASLNFTEFKLEQFEKILAEKYAIVFHQIDEKIRNF